MRFDYSKLKGRIVEKYGSQKNFAKAFGISENSMSLKMSNKTFFSPEDMRQLIKLNIEQELDLLGIDYPSGKSHYYISCPFCSQAHTNKRKTMNIDPSKGQYGVFSCLRCNEQGGAIDFWRKMKGLNNNKQAAKDIQRTIGNSGDSAPIIPKQKRNRKERAGEDRRPAPIDKRSETYNAFLDLLVLSDYHRQKLRERGLSNKEIERKKYKSFPGGGLEQKASVLLEQGFLLENVPGFYKKNGQWTIRNFGSGILIPQRNGFSQIQGFQIRMDNPNFGKYLNFTSSDLPEGTKTMTYTSISLGKQADPAVAYLTEGVLKADVISYLTGQTVISIPGVNCVKFLPRALHDLKKKGLRKIKIAFDMDLCSNPNVRCALSNLKNILRETDLYFVLCKWDEKYKGLDDYLCAEAKIQK